MTIRNKNRTPDKPEIGFFITNILNLWLMITFGTFKIFFLEIVNFNIHSTHWRHGHNIYVLEKFSGRTWEAPLSDTLKYIKR